MRLVATRRLSSGSRLGRDVPAPHGGPVPLLREGVLISNRHREALLAAGINAVYVDDGIGEGIEVPQALTEETRQEARSALGRALADAPAMVADGRALEMGTVIELERIATLIASEVADSGDARSRCPTSPAPTPTRSSTRST